MKYISTIFLAMLTCVSAFGQSKTVADFQEDTDGYKLFLYQSVIRVMNKDKNPDFNQLIRNLDHFRFVSTKPDSESAKTTFKQIDQGVQGEGFEEIMRFDMDGNKCRVYELESNRGQSSWVVTLLMEDVAGAMEMKGSLDLRYLSALQSLNMDKVKDMLPLDKMKEEVEEAEEK